MELDVSRLLGETLAELDQSGEVEKHIKDIFRKSVFSAVDDVLSGYELRRTIEKRLEEKLPDIVASIGLDGYVEYVAQAAKSIVESVQGEEIRQHANAAISTMLLKKRKSIKVSEIIAAFADECKKQDEELRQKNDCFEVSIRNEPGSYPSSFYHYGLKLTWNGDDRWDQIKVEFGMCYRPGTPSEMAHLTINGETQDGKIGIRRLNKLEALLLSCYYNKVPVDVDVTDPDDVDTCVWEEDY